MAIKISGTTVIDNSRNLNAGIMTVTRRVVPPTPLTFSPAIGATDVSISSNIIITFGQQVYKGTGNITLRSGSAGGTVLQTIAVSSGAVTISGGAIFYLNTNNGLTVLEDKIEIKSIENRLLTFDASVPHHSTTCGDDKCRVNVNFNFF